MKRVFWTSGHDHADATRQLGDTRPVCSGAKQAYEFRKEGEKLYRVTVEEFSLEKDQVMDVYFKMIDPEGSIRIFHYPGY